jgi:CspA family cold shock protein
MFLRFAEAVEKGPLLAGFFVSAQTDPGLRSRKCGNFDPRSPVAKFPFLAKGYGFIQPDGATKDVFVHISAVERAGLSTLAEGAKVTFDIVDNRGKEAAENLRLK